MLTLTSREGLPAGFLLISLWLVACATSGATKAKDTSVVDSLDGQRDAIADFAEAVHGLLGQDGDLTTLMVDDLALHDLLSAQSATRVQLARHQNASAARLSPLARRLLSTTSYYGACVQELRFAGSGGAFAPLQPRWIFHRLLLEAQNGGDDRIGMWLEGTFIGTESGYRILLLDRVEAPRKGHADLDLAPCDLRDHGR